MNICKICGRLCPARCNRCRCCSRCCCCAKRPCCPQCPNTPIAPNADLPLVHRIVVQGTFEGELRPLILELDRPAPANCFLQFYRYSKKSRDRGLARDRSLPSKYAFRGIFVDGNSNPFPVIPIPEGATSVALTWEEWNDIYRPVVIRGYKRDWAETPPGRPRWNPVNYRRENKVIYKFGTCEYIRGELFRPSQMSADTLTIIRHYASYGSNRIIIRRAYLR